MTEPTGDWYAAMAKAVKTREHALAMIDRWQKKLSESEAAIQQLSSGTVPEQEQSSDEPAAV